MPLDADSIGRFIDAVYERETVKAEEGDEVPLAPHGIKRRLGEGLESLVRAEGAVRTIEVGLAAGLSALFICRALISSGKPDARHVAIDPFQEEYWRNAGLVSLRESGADELVEVVEEESQVALPQLVVEDQSFDFAFIDGDHKFESVFLDLYYMNRLVKPGGVIVIDDTWMPAVRLAVAYFEKNVELELLPDALPGAFRWRSKRPFSNDVRPGIGEPAVLRTPIEPRWRHWNSFVDFC
jgi:predicted O-methyltransferase YrrM